ncbi:MAG: hypothetical protein R2712_03465 [Vicinamibacterales bacterium]
MTLLLPAMLVGVVAGMRTMTAPAAVSWAASLGRLALGPSALRYLAHPAAHGSSPCSRSASSSATSCPPHPAAPFPCSSAHASCRAPSAVSPSACRAAHRWRRRRRRPRRHRRHARWTLVPRPPAEAFGRDRPAGFLEDAVAILLAASTLTQLV